MHAYNISIDSEIVSWKMLNCRENGTIVAMKQQNFKSMN